MKTKKTGSRQGANPELARAMVGKRSSGAAGPHLDRRGRRARTRGASLARALREQ